MKLYDDLKWRGLIKDISSPELEKKLNEDTDSEIVDLKDLESLCNLVCEYILSGGVKDV